MLGQFLLFYLTVQIIGAVTLPLTWRFFSGLPDRGYAFARILGIFLVGLIFWLGYAYGFLRNELGGAWLAVLIVAAISCALGYPALAAWRQRAQGSINWRYVAMVEMLFLLTFAWWAWVRSHAPGIEHTEQPMDLMFMNSIRASATFPPQDAWLAGWPIAYYYLGYWLVTMLGTLTGSLPEVTYNVGQAAWFGLLLTGSFGVGYNLLAADRRSSTLALAGGLLAAVMVGLAANVQGIMEWLYANGIGVGPVAAFLHVPNFPEQAHLTNQWYVDSGWWWWRSARVLEDLNLEGKHIEVIDEFPAFSYLLGDNHPHVTAMPFVLLVIGMALNVFRQGASLAGEAAALVAGGPAPAPGLAGRLRGLAQQLQRAMPLGWIGWLLAAAATGALIALNTWDYPFYWLLLVAAVFAAQVRAGTADRLWLRVRPALLVSALGAVILAAGAVIIYFPYLLTAQSQADGIAANLLQPTRLGQFVAMFGTMLPAIGALILLAWAAFRPRTGDLIVCAALVFGLPLIFLLTGAWVVSTPKGRELFTGLPLPPGADSYVPFIVARWTSQPFTFLLAGALLALTAALAWRSMATRQPEAPSLTFALLLAALGLALVYAPEFVYLRDNFGTRMNTVFKFYYQGWLLMALAGAYAVATALADRRVMRRVPAVLGGLSLVLVLLSLIYLPAGAYSQGRDAGDQPTFDGLAYMQRLAPDELAAVQWLRDNTLPTDRLVEAKGDSYRADTVRMSTMTGRPTLLGWEGHEGQWRGKAYGAMAGGRAQAIDLIYRDAAPDQVKQLLDDWDIRYVVVGPNERAKYGLPAGPDARLSQVMDLVFDRGLVQIYRTR